MLAEWANLNPGIASWIQAIGSILAIIAAIGVVQFDHVLARRAAAADRRIQGRGLALAIYLPLLELKARIEGLRETIGLRLATNSLQQAHATLLEAEIDVAPALAQGIDRMHLLGPVAGSEVQQLVSVIGQYNRAVGRLLAKTSKGEPFHMEKSPVEQLQPWLDSAADLIGKAVELVGPIHDNKTP